MSNTAAQKLHESRIYHDLITQTEGALHGMLLEPETLDCEVIQALFVELCKEADRITASDPFNRRWVADLSAHAFGHLGHLWQEHIKWGSTELLEHQEQFHDLALTLMQTTGLPERGDILLIGLGAELDRFIVDSIVAYRLPAEKFMLVVNDSSLKGMIDERYLAHITELMAISRTDEALDLVEAIEFTARIDGHPWNTQALFNLGIALFDEQRDLSEHQLHRIKTFMGNFKPCEDYLNSLARSFGNLINMARSGLKSEAASYVGLGFKKFDAMSNIFSKIDRVTLLADLERELDIDVTPMLAHWASMHNSGQDTDDALNVVVGYQLLGTKTPLQQDLLEFSDDEQHQIFSRVASRSPVIGAGYTGHAVNQQHLRSLIAEFMAQRSGAIKAMSRDKVIGSIVRSLPEWYVDELETDLGL